MQKQNDFEKIKKLIKLMKDNNLVEIELKHGDEKILLKSSHPQQPSVTAVPMVNSAVPMSAAGLDNIQSAAAGQEQQQQNLVEIKAPLVGTFYDTPSPDSEPYVETGSAVEPQTVVCIIEAMKVMNEIKAETTGTITEIIVKNGQAVEYGEVLFKVKPD